MSVFNFLETFFFISLGITFVLILLLVYHFKQRLTSLEQKSDTMFEIMNNIVKELGFLKNVTMTMRPSNLTNMAPFFDNQNTLSSTFEYLVNPPAMNDVQSPVDSQNKMTLEEIIECDDDNDDDVDDDYDGDDDGDDDADDDSDDDSDCSIMYTGEVFDITYDDDIDYGKDILKIVVSDNEDDDNNIKIVNINTPELNITEVINIKDFENLDKDSQEKLTDLEELEPYIDVQEIPEPVQSGTLENVQEIPEPVQYETLDNVQETSIDELENKINDKPILGVAYNNEIYRKMHIQELKALVVSKGVTQDASKMKKNELLKLLESIDV